MAMRLTDGPPRLLKDRHGEWAMVMEVDESVPLATQEAFFRESCAGMKVQIDRGEMPGPPIAIRLVRDAPWPLEAGA